MAQRGNRFPYIKTIMEMEPFKIYPICFHPVLAGETVHDLFIDGRGMINGLNSMMSGWYLDVMYAFVKLRDIDEALVDQFIDPDWSIPTEYQPSTQRDLGELTGGQGLNYLRKAVEILYEYYIQKSVGFYHGGLPIAPLKYPDSFQNFYALAEDVSTTVEGHGQIIQEMVEDIDNYAEVLEAYGIKGAALRNALPEIILWRSLHNYPILSAIDDEAEVLTRTNCIWTVRESRGTRRGLMMTEPGFLVGIAYMRPAVVHGNKKSWTAGWVNGPDYWFLPPFDLSEGIGTVSSNEFDNFSAVGNLHYNKFDLYMNGETFTNIDPDGTSNSQLKGAVAKLPEANADLSDIRTDYPRQGAVTDLDTYMPNLLKSDYYAGMDTVTRFRVETMLVE